MMDSWRSCFTFFFFFQAEDGIRDHCVTGVQTCALPISASAVTYDLGVSSTGVLRLAPFGTPPMAVVDGQASHELPSWLPRLPIGTPQAILIALVLLSLGSGLALLFLARRHSKLNGGLISTGGP